MVRWLAIAGLGLGCGGSEEPKGEENGGCTFGGKDYAKGDVFFSEINGLCCRCDGPPTYYTCGGSICPSDQPTWANEPCGTPVPEACPSWAFEASYCGAAGSACSTQGGSMCLACRDP